MVTKRLCILATAFAAAGLLLPQPARAITAIGQPFGFSIDEATSMLFSLSGVSRYMAIVEGNVTIAAARRGLLQTAAEINYHRPRQKPGYQKPWQGYEPCANCPNAGSRAPGSRRQLEWSIHIIGHSRKHRDEEVNVMTSAPDADQHRGYEDIGI